MLKALILLAAGLASVAVSSAPALANPGDLDPGFNGDGTAVTHLAGTDWGEAVAVQPDGKIVVAATASGRSAHRFAIVRYTAAGKLDSTFSGNGKAQTKISDCGCASAFALALQPDGKIVVAGMTWVMTSNGLGRARFALVRYRSNGSLDRSFGQKGRIITDLSRGYEAAHAVIVRPNGKIVVAGTAAGFRTIALVRYKPDGTLDPTFGSDGEALADVAAGRSEGASDLAAQANGKLVASGSVALQFALVRFTRSGVLDTGFGGDGVVTTDFGGQASAAGVATLADGKIVAGGTREEGGVVLARYKSGGSLDPTFDDDGKAVASAVVTVNDVVVQEDGRIVAAGTNGSGFRLARFGVDGSLDSTFGSGGTVSTNFPGDDTEVEEVALQADGRLVAVGWTGHSGEFVDWHHVAVARYLGG